MNEQTRQQQDKALREKVTKLAAQCNVAEYHFLKSLAELIEREAWVGTGIRSCAHWLNWRCGISEISARQKVLVAKRLQDLPLINAAFGRGEISYSKVRVMTRIATVENEEYMLMLARHGSATHLEQSVRKYRRVKRAEEDRLEQKQQRDRMANWYQAEDGMWVIQCRLPPEEGSLVVKAIESIAKPMQQETQQALLDARAEKAERDKNNDPAGSFEDTAESTAGNYYAAAMIQTRADAIVGMAEHCLATGTGDGETKALPTADKCHVMLHVDINTLRNQAPQSDCAHQQCNLDQQQWVSPATAKRLSCDASLMTALEDDKGNVLNIGRRSRTVPGHIRKAVEMRDQGCRFPGCGRRHVDAHHIQHWADGGETSTDNLVSLCKHHHRLLHRGGFEIQPTGNGLRFVTDESRRVEEVIYPQFAQQLMADAEASHQQNPQNVDSRTCISLWDGVQPDYSMIVDGLKRRDKNDPAGSWRRL